MNVSSSTWAHRRPDRLDDDSSKEDESNASNDIVEILDMAPVQAVRPPPARTSNSRFHYSLDDALSDSSSSLEGYIKSLTIAEEKQPFKEEQELVDTDEQVDDDDDASSISSNEDTLLSDPESAWAFDATRKEYYLCNKGGVNNNWPTLRMPQRLFDNLYPHQRVGIQWMASLHTTKVGGGCLCDDMGLGKTRMVLAFLASLMRTGAIRNALIVAPTSVLRSWFVEARHILVKTCHVDATISVLSSDYSVQQRKRITRKALETSSSSRRPHIVITSYGLVRSSTEDFKHPRYHWDYVVLDEGHVIKNHKSAIHVACHSVAVGARRLLLSGTPILNQLQELWSLMDWATSSAILGDLASYKMYYSRPIEAARDKDASKGDILHGKRVNEELQAVLKPYFLQRMKADVLASQLPNKLEVVVWTHLSPVQRSMYTDFVESRDSVVRQILRGDMKSPLQAIAHLKKLCGHPLLAKKENEADFERQLATSEPIDLIQDSAKLRVLAHLVRSLRDAGHRTLVFSQSTMMLDIIQVALDDVCLSRIDGSTKEQDRQRLVDEFNSEPCVFEAMLLSTKAAGCGLTLCGADRVVIYDPAWTPAEDSQAVDRCYRIGQTKNVLVYRLIAAGTVEEKMYEKQIHKDGISRTVLTEIETVQRYFSRSELRALFTLSPVGTCPMIDNGITKKYDGAELGEVGTDARSHIVAFSRHDGFYGKQESSATEEVVENCAGQVPANNPVLGRARRALLTESTEIVPVGGKARSAVVFDDEEITPNKPVPIVHVPDDKEINSIAIVQAGNIVQNKRLVDGENNLNKTAPVDDKANSSNHEIITVLFRQADELKARGQYRKLLKLLINIRDDHNQDMDRHQVVSLKDRINQTVKSLGC